MALGEKKMLVFSLKNKCGVEWSNRLTRYLALFVPALIG